MDPKALYKLTYGVYLLSAREGDRDNACIINTAVQTASNPNRISIAAVRGGFTHDMIARTGEFNISSITQEADMELFRRFGMQSGRDTDKLNGIIFLNKESEKSVQEQKEEIQESQKRNDYDYDR